MIQDQQDPAPAAEEAPAPPRLPTLDPERLTEIVGAIPPATG